ncbi:WecB/TagA/CpsF family glycosyltransferase [Capillibacterium thermochitinicola]|uniref:WecB/TagA/CpsF family glycosyltransferase n=1 Tax=Capillibacterium thermochitinicola TaxID=2699427 RepID=A0A8J6LIH7_9FIRM|nr:WecB/TagA/CpsF family glycosyltransferase [Capillibacterium thermochitinicola]
MVYQPGAGGTGARVRVEVLGFPVDPLPLGTVVDRLSSALATGERLRVVTLNPEMVMAALNHPELGKAIHGAGLVVPDGIGIVWALRRQGWRRQRRVTGVDLVETLLAREQPRRRRLFLLGGEPGVGERAAAKIEQRWPGIAVAGVHHGFFAPEENAKVVGLINQARADLLLVGMGVPRQEVWLHQYWSALQVAVGIGVGGLLDLWAGRSKRAPVLLRNLGLEWAYRVWREPARWRRITVLPAFIRMVRAEQLNNKKDW